MIRTLHPWPFIVAFCLLALGCVLAVREYRLAYPGALQVHMLDVGQGDGILLVTPLGKQIVIDGGPDLSALQGLGRHMPFFDRTIDLLVLSHSDSDHVGAFPEILRRYTVGSVLMTGNASQTPRYREFLDLLKEQGIPLILADPTRDIDMGDGVLLDVLWPKPGLFGITVKDPNNASVVLRATYGSSSILFTGDMEDKEEREVLAAGIDLNADILKVAHHGSRTSTSTGIILAVTPSLAIVSVGADNTYGHPHPSVVARLKHFGVPIRTTADEGEITISLGD